MQHAVENHYDKMYAAKKIVYYRAFSHVNMHMHNFIKLGNKYISEKN